MSRIVQKILDSLKLTDEDDEFEDDEEFEEEDDNVAENIAKRDSPHLRKYDVEDEDDEDTDEDEEEENDYDASYPPRRTFSPKPSTQQQRSGFSHPRTASNVRSNISGFEIVNLCPKSFEDAQQVCETLKNGGVVYLNFEGVRYELAQRLMDFAGGSVYALGGQIYQVSGYNFLIAPNGVDIKGDIIAHITNAGNDFPTFNKY